MRPIIQAGIRIILGALMLPVILTVLLAIALVALWEDNRRYRQHSRELARSDPALAAAT